MEKEIHSHYQEMVKDIRDFIEKERKPSTILDGLFKELETTQNIATIELLDKFYFRKGSLVLVDNFLGTVTDAHKNKIKVEFKKDTQKLLDKRVNIDTSLDNIILDRLDKTIVKIEDYELDDYSQKILDFLVKKGKPGYNKIEPYNSISDLNASQKEAIESALAAHDFHLIMGPPGTGKTFVIKELIKESIKDNNKLLITAWTNVGVDNIMERLEDIDEDLMVRVGPVQSISPSVIRYSLHHKREKHPRWVEILQHDNTIKQAYDDIRNKKDEFDEIRTDISQINEQKSTLESKIDDFNHIQNKFSSRVIKFKPLPIKRSIKLKMKEDKISGLEDSVDKCCLLAEKILEFKNIEKHLPSADSYHQLEYDLEELNKQKSWKRISTIFSPKNYKQFIDEIKNKESSYQNMTDQYNYYWKLRDGAEAEHNKIYSGRDGKPDEDALKYEMELLNIYEGYLSLKKDELEVEMEHDKNKVIYESYMQYLVSLEGNLENLNLEIKNLKTQIHLILNKKERLSLEIKNIHNTILKHQDDKKNLIKEIEEEIIADSKLIATTVISSAQYLLNEQIFDLMIMDEASQVASFMSLLTLLKCKKFILVGDHQQLQPIAEDKLKSDLNISIFNRLMHLYPENHTFLDTQYRMNQKIADISSELFYEGKLKTYPPIGGQTLEYEFESPLINSNPITFIDTNGTESYEEGIGSSCENLKEAKITTTIVSTLLKHLNSHDVGVITPYKRQKMKISQMLDNAVEVDTVHRFQGREKEVIILSFCNSKIGILSPFKKKFIGNPSQINVALTRARKKLIIVGNSKTLKQSKLIGDVLERIGEVDTVNYQEFL